MNRMIEVNDFLQIQIQESSGSTLIYLPGTHGDWTLNCNLRRELKGRARFVEFTFPRTQQWSLADYASAVDKTLIEHGVHRGWVLAESFASQVAWAWIGRKHQFEIQGIILAGGFVRHPSIPAVHFAKLLLRNMPMPVLKTILRIYTAYARFREGNSAEANAALQEFLERRTPEDVLAAVHRLNLIARNDLRPIARTATIPIYYLTGYVDPIVPWPFVSRWLKKHCVGFRDWKIIFTADHHVLGSARKSSEQILRWMMLEQNLDLSTQALDSTSRN